MTACSTAVTTLSSAYSMYDSDSCGYSLQVRGLRKRIIGSGLGGGSAGQELCALMHAINSISPDSISMSLDRIHSADGISCWLVGQLSRRL